MSINDGNDNKIMYYTYYPVFLGMVLGSFFFLILSVSSDLLLFDKGLEDFKICSVLNLPAWNLVVYILRRRFFQIILFGILVVLFSYPLVAGLFNFSFGIYFGAILCSLFLKFAFRGLWYCLACFFPHYIIYFFTIYYIGKWFFNDDKRYISYGNVNKLQYFIQIFVIFFVIFLALFWEIKIQKNFLNYFFQYLV